MVSKPLDQPEQPQLLDVQRREYGSYRHYAKQDDRKYLTRVQALLIVRVSEPGLEFPYRALQFFVRGVRAALALNLGAQIVRLLVLVSLVLGREA